MPVTFQLLLTLVSSSNAKNAATLWGFIGRYRPGVTRNPSKLDARSAYAINITATSWADQAIPRADR